MIPLLRAASIVLQSRRQKSTNLVLLNLSKAASNSLNMLKLSPTLKPTLSASSFSYRVYGSGEWVTLHITCRRDCASDKIYSQCRCSKENTSDPGAGAVATAIIIIKSIIINCYNSYNMLYVYKYSVHINLLCMIKVRVRWCTCSLWRML